MQARLKLYLDNIKEFDNTPESELINSQDLKTLLEEIRSFFKITENEELRNIVNEITDYFEIFIISNEKTLIKQIKKAENFIIQAYKFIDFDKLESLLSRDSNHTEGEEYLKTIIIKNKNSKRYYQEEIKQFFAFYYENYNELLLNPTVFNDLIIFLKDLDKFFSMVSITNYH